MQGCNDFPFQNDQKNLDPSFKMDLDFSDCFEDGSRFLGPMTMMATMPI